GSPVVGINRAVALAETSGPAAGLALLDALADDVRLADYQPYWAARAGLLARTGAAQAADQAYERAIGLEADPAVRAVLQQRRAALRAHQASPAIHGSNKPSSPTTRASGPLRAGLSCRPIKSSRGNAAMETTASSRNTAL